MLGKSLLKLFFTIILVSASGTGYSQSLASVDAKIKTYPSTRFDSVAQLATLIDRDFETKLEKVRAIYSWITRNVAYSYDAQNSMSISYRSEIERVQKEKQHQERIARITLRSKKAVCHGYALLFKELCDQLNIPCQVIRGFGKSFLSDIATEYEINHAWNKVNIDGEDYLFDATWGAGYMNGSRFIRAVNYVYFMTPPEHFIKNHYPDIASDALLDKVPGKQEFLLDPLVYDHALTDFDLMNPAIGVLREDSTVEFEIVSSQAIRSIHAYVSGRFHNVLELSAENDRYTFKIDLSNYNGRELMLYLNDKAAFGFKIKP